MLLKSSHSCVCGGACFIECWCHWVDMITFRFLALFLGHNLCFSESKHISFLCGLCFTDCLSNQMTCSLPAWPKRWEATAELTSSDVQDLNVAPSDELQSRRNSDQRIKNQFKWALNKRTSTKRQRQDSKTESKSSLAWYMSCVSYICVCVPVYTTEAKNFQQVMHLPCDVQHVVSWSSQLNNTQSSRQTHRCAQLGDLQRRGDGLTGIAVQQCTVVLRCLLAKFGLTPRFKNESFWESKRYKSETWVKIWKNHAWVQRRL